MEKQFTKIAGWGNYPLSSSLLTKPHKREAIPLSSSSLIARGLGRSYGDAALNDGGTVVQMEGINRLVAFDPRSGILKAEGGVSLQELLDLFVPRGWFLPVTPGTKFVTLAGAVACDVHGKNHHVDGSFADHVLEMELLLADGTRKRCSADKNSFLFWATVGGMGLTGVVTEVTIQMLPIETAYMHVSYRSARDLDTVFESLKNDHEVKYSVAWIDCLAGGKNLGRSIVMNGRHALPEEVPHRSDPFLQKKKKGIKIPFNFPSFSLNPITVKLFNELYFRMQSRKKHSFFQHYDSYFYPLDSIGEWNRIYGKKGFIQYQFVLPPETAKEGLFQILSKFSKGRKASFLAVLKRFGEEGKGLLSFPQKGYTLALDIPMSDQLLPFLDALDQEVLRFGGRIYLAKDARMGADLFRQMYPKIDQWERIKQQVDPKNKFSSDLSKRLKIGRTDG